MSIEGISVGCYQAENGGYLSPRQLVAAQKKIASDHGVVVMSSLVTSLDKDEGQGWIVTTSGGDILQSEKVVLCQVQRCFIRNIMSTPWLTTLQP